MLGRKPAVPTTTVQKDLKNEATGEETFQADGHIHYLDCGGGFVDIYIYIYIYKYKNI